jgi:hypothetical protein
MINLKAEPEKYLTEAEKYLLHFWNPQAGDKVICRGEKYTLKEIDGVQATVIESDKIVWIQDLAWKPTLENCDNLIKNFNAVVVDNNQIQYRTPKQKCFFQRPTSIDDYRDIIRQLRVLNYFKH